MMEPEKIFDPRIFASYTDDPYKATILSSTLTSNTTSPFIHHYGNPTYKISTFDGRTWDTNVFRKELSEYEGVKTMDKITNTPGGKEFTVACSYKPDLEQDKILKSLSMMKGKLMIQCSPVRIHHIVCKMTPQIKHNITMAYRRLSMYGKKTPFIARFDEYGRRLEDEIKIETLEGMTIQIVSPSDFGDLYIEFSAKIADDWMYSPAWDYKYSDDVPF